MLVPAHHSFGFMLDVADWAVANRESLWLVWPILVVFLAGLQVWWLLRADKNLLTKKVWWLIAIVELVACLGYPFISDDIFSYLYSGKMVVDYKVNPYVVMPKEFFGKDQWLFFVKNVDNVYYKLHNIPITYYYGPVFLGYTSLFVKIVGGGKFLGLFFGWKLLNWWWFLLTGWLLMKIVEKKNTVLAIWFFNPLLQFELLVNNHNDLLMICVFLMTFIVSQKNRLWTGVLLGLSVLIKFVTVLGVPLYFLNEKWRRQGFKLMGFAILLLNAVKPLHLWYYSWIYLFFPIGGLKKSSWAIIFLGQMLMMLNYSGYIKYGRWTGAPFLPSMETVRWILLVLVIFWEYKRFLKINLLKYKYF
ncbi:DUF2029 domain-containing protein [Candidatus Shapirobacteria bacterium]|nr:DUF2029 domain-containing protein [Candidatus Shapirobacteria bacterium]